MIQVVKKNKKHFLNHKIRENKNNKYIILDILVLRQNAKCFGGSCRYRFENTFGE